MEAGTGQRGTPPLPPAMSAKPTTVSPYLLHKLVLNVVVESLLCPHRYREQNASLNEGVETLQLAHILVSTESQ